MSRLKKAAIANKTQKAINFTMAIKIRSKSSLNY